MKKFMMQKMMPMMSGTIEKMEFSEKEEMMGTMMPRMMSNLSMEEKMKMMQKMMPMMMKDMDISQMENMMDTMMPTMMNQMQEKGINLFDMMRMMCPKCVSVATSQASDEDKKKLKSDMTEVFAKI
jgi:hypothetical protein